MRYSLPLSREAGAGGLCGCFNRSRELSSLLLGHLHTLVADLLGRGSLIRPHCSPGRCIGLKNDNRKFYLKVKALTSIWEM